MSRAAKIAYALALMALVASAVMQVRSGNAGDKNWLLLAARMWVHGKKLGVDIFEVNPPLVIWLYAIPVFLSEHIPSVPDFEWLAGIGLAATACSVALGVRLIGLHPAFAHAPRARLAFALLLACVLFFFTTQINFFDRDHIFFALTFPYMLRFMPSLARQKLSPGLRMAVALLAALGFCIKPVTLLVFAVFQLLFIMRERSPAILWCMENLVIYAIGIVYLGCLWHFTPEYITEVMPVAMAAYADYNRRVNAYLYLTIAFISAGLTFADFRPRHDTPYRRDAYYLIGAAVAYLFYALAGNGWGYTFNPLLCMLLFLSGWMIWDYGWLKRDAEANGKSSDSFRFGRRASIANLALNAAYMLLCLGTYFTTARCGAYAECSGNEPFSSYIRVHHVRSFATMSMNLRRWAVLVRATGTSWDTRFNHLWMLPHIFLSGGPDAVQNRWLVDYLGKAYAQDLTNNRPEIMFVDESEGIFDYPHPVDMIGLVNRVPEFAAAWSHYRFTAIIDECPHKELGNYMENNNNIRKPSPHIDCRFTIYTRLPEAETK